MENDNLPSRVERTFWTIWNHISGAISRLLRPDPPDIISHVPSPFQESEVTCGPADYHVEDDDRGTEADEERPLSKVSGIGTSRSVVAWDVCTTDSHKWTIEKTVTYKTQATGGSETKARTETEGTRDQERFQPRQDEAGLVVAEDVERGKQGENGVNEPFTRKPAGMQERDEHEEHMKTMSGHADDVMIEDAEENRRKSSAEETTNLDDHQIIKIKIVEENKMHDEDQKIVKGKDTEVNLPMTEALLLEEENNISAEETSVQRDEAHTPIEISLCAMQLATDVKRRPEGAAEVEYQLLVAEEVPVYDEETVTVSDDGRQHGMPHRSESDKAEDELKQTAITEEEHANEDGGVQISGVPEKDDNKESVPEEGEEDISTIHGENVVQDSISDLEFDNAETQTEKKDTDGAETESHGDLIALTSDETADTSVDQSSLVGDQVEGASLCREEGNKDSNMVLVCPVSSLTVNPEGETEGEISEHFKNASLEKCEGQLDVSLELNTPACEETQGELPEYNNEPGLNGMTTQRFLEVRESEGIQTTQSQEDAESQELESPRSSSRNVGVDCLLVRNHMEEEQRRSEDIQKSIDLVVEDRVGRLSPADAGLPQEMETQLTEAADGEGVVSVDSLKTGINYSEKELDVWIGLTDETDEMSKWMPFETEELVVEYGMDEGSEVKEGGANLEAGVVEAQEVVKCTEDALKWTEAELREATSFFKQSEEDLNPEQNSHQTLNLLEDFSESGISEQEIKKPGHGIEEEAAESELPTQTRMLNVQVEDEETTKRNEKEDTLISESDPQEAQNQRSDKAGEISNEENEEADEAMMTSESTLKDITVVSAGEVQKHVIQSEGRCAEEAGSLIDQSTDQPLHVVEEEVLDFWMNALFSAEGDGMKEKELVPGQRIDIKRELSYEGHAEMLSETTAKEKQQLVESNSGESELVSGTKLSSSTTVSVFLEQSPYDCGETQLLDSTSSESFQNNIFANTSESMSISEPLAKKSSYSSLDIFLGENTEVPRSSKPLNKELDRSQEKYCEETESQEDTDVELIFANTPEWKDNEGADAESLKEVDALFKVEETMEADKSQEMTVSDSTDEIQPESVQSETDSEALEKGTVPTGSQNVCNETGDIFRLPSQSLRSKGVVDPLSGLNTDEDTGQIRESEHRVGVDISLLDLTVQRSRIAVKNPRVRPPKNPRALLHMPSMNPTPASSLPVKIPAGVPVGGFGVGIKLPGLGTDFPTLKKTQVMRDGNAQKTISQEPDTKPEKKNDTSRQDEPKVKPKLMPPRHPGFANPLMSELKAKLKKTTKSE